jgi:acyl carrier protein
MTMTLLSDDIVSYDIVSDGVVCDDVGGRVRIELEARTGVPAAELTDEASLSDIGLDSLALIEVLMSLREQVLAERGLSMDDADDPEFLPWMETVGDLIGFAATFAPSSGSEG